MKKNVMLLVIVLFVLLLTNDCFADRVDLIIEKLVENKSSEALEEVNFSGTTLWVILACFGISFGMISLSSSIARHFVEGAGNTDAGSMAFSGISNLTKRVVSGGSNIGKFGTRAIWEKMKEKDLKSARSAGNRTYEGGNGGNDDGASAQEPKLAQNNATSDIQKGGSDDFTDNQNNNNSPNANNGGPEPIETNTPPKSANDKGGTETKEQEKQSSDEAPVSEDNREKTSSDESQPALSSITDLNDQQINEMAGMLVGLLMGQKEGNPLVDLLKNGKIDKKTWKELVNSMRNNKRLKDAFMMKAQDSSSLKGHYDNNSYDEMASDLQTKGDMEIDQASEEIKVDNSPNSSDEKGDNTVETPKEESDKETLENKEIKDNENKPKKEDAEKNKKEEYTVKSLLKDLFQSSKQTENNADGDKK